jgi:hypothetical protein
VDWILENTVQKHGEGSILDPSCGSGSFLVRYAHWRLEDAQKRKLDKDLVRQELQGELWGFDLNPFASFITYFQMIWALLRFQPKSQAPQIHVYNINSLLRDETLGQTIGADLLPPGSLERDTKKWKYIVGNPPYIRAERIKYGEEIKQLWSEVWGQNADTGLIFLYRSITEWLEDGGFLGMVVSGGYASSEAAAKVWKLLHPNGQASLRKIVWLEFSGKVWDANVIPLVLIIEKTPPKDDDMIEIYTPETWDEKIKAKPQRVKYTDFWDKKVNPKVTDTDTALGAAYPWGDYLLPLLEAKDAAIQRKIMPNGKEILELTSVVQQRGTRSNRWTFGIQRGGVEISETSGGKRSVSIIAGRSISVGFGGNAHGWIDLDAVKARPNGKLSLWTNEAPTKYFAVQYIGLAPAAALIETSVSDSVAAINSVIVGIPDEKIAKAEAVAAFLNSKIIRFTWLIKQRSGVLEGSSRSQVYPRTLEALPFPCLTPELEQRLVVGYTRLSELAKVAKNNPHQWFLDAALEQLKNGAKKITSPEFGLSFEDWGQDVLASELVLDGLSIHAGLFGIGFSNPSVALYVFHLLTVTADDETRVSKKSIQSLQVPNKLEGLVQEFTERLSGFASVEQDFMAVLGQIDSAIYDAFGLSPDERAYIETRLSSFPLNRLQPRYPWQAVSVRSIKAYTEDRFA